MKTRWLITGCRGQLGSALAQRLAADSGCEIVAAVDLPECDVADPAAVKQLFEDLGAPPDIVVNAAAFTHVDRCERQPEDAHRANALAPGHLAEACARIGCRFAHVSTDYVFAGDGHEPYTEDAPPQPRSTYGRTKLEGEERVRAVSSDFLIVRTSWVFGCGRNFLAAILDQARARRSGAEEGPLRVVDDQTGRPTYAVDLAGGIQALLARGATGLVHLANDGRATWWDVARLCLDEAGFADLAIDRIATSDLDLPAARPAWSVLDCSRAASLGVSLREWPDAVRAYLASPESPA